MNADLNMAEDLYTTWLGIPEGPRPPDHYALLGVPLFCSDIDGIETAARKRIQKLDRYRIHPQRAKRKACNALMNEVAQARMILIDPERRKVYDAALTTKQIPATPAALLIAKADTLPAITRAHAVTKRVPLTRLPEGIASKPPNEPVRLQQLQSFEGLEGRVVSLAISRDGRTLAAGANNIVRTWDLHSGRGQRTMRAFHPVKALCFSRDGLQIRLLAGIRVRMLSLLTGECMQAVPMLPKGENAFVSAAFSSDGERVLCGNGGILLWDLKSNRCTLSRKHFPLTVRSVALSPNGVHAVVAFGNRIELWDLTTQKKHASLEGHKGPVCVICINPSGSRMLSGSLDHDLRLWEMPAGKCLRVMHAHKEAVQAICFACNGELALSGSRDGTLCLWDVQSGQSLTEVKAHESGVACCCSSLDGNHLVSAGMDGTVTSWNVLGRRSDDALYDLI